MMMSYVIWYDWLMFSNAWVWLQTGFILIMGLIGHFKKISVTTDCQSASQSWCHKAIWGPWSDSYYCQTVADMMMCGAVPSLTRGWGCSLQFVLGLANADILGSVSHRIHYRILLSQITDSPTWKARASYYYPQECIPFSNTMLVCSAYFGHRRWKQKTAAKHWYTASHYRTFYSRIEKPVNLRCNPIDTWEVMHISETELCQ
jgi:hypothetical protein